MSEPHSPSRCATSSGFASVARLAAGIKGEPAPEPAPCRCPCRGCQRGECVQNGFPPMKPARRVRVAAKFHAEAQRVLRPLELPEGRTACSYRYFVEALHAGSAVDEYLTDHRDEADRLVGAILRDGYEARVTSREVLGREPRRSAYGVVEETHDV